MNRPHWVEVEILDDSMTWSAPPRATLNTDHIIEVKPLNGGTRTLIFLTDGRRLRCTEGYESLADRVVYRHWRLGPGNEDGA